MVAPRRNAFNVTFKLVGEAFLRRDNTLSAHGLFSLLSEAIISSIVL